MPLSGGRQRDAESLCAQSAPRALALPERGSVALNEPPALPACGRVKGGGDACPRGRSERNRRHAWHAGIEAIASGGGGGGPGGRRRRRHHPGGVLLSIRDGAAAVPALPRTTHCVLRVYTARH